MEEKYARILHLAHPVSQTRARLSPAQRAAQFAPFAALTGFEAVIRETARQTEAEIFLDESRKQEIDRCLAGIKASLDQRPAVCLRYFVPDERKAGGSYRQIQGRVRRIDEYSQEIGLENGEIIPFSGIVQIFECENL